MTSQFRAPAALLVGNYPQFPLNSSLREMQAKGIKEIKIGKGKKNQMRRMERQVFLGFPVSISKMFPKTPSCHYMLLM